MGARLYALAGNPNVGKSTVFNSLTGLHQHTGNWSGKTVATARGVCRVEGESFTLVDLPGCCSLIAHSREEAVARDFLCFGGADGIVLVCDGGCLERNLNLVLQCLETGLPALVLVNLMDEAKRRGIAVDTEALSRALGVPVLPVTARSGKSRETLRRALLLLEREERRSSCPVRYPEIIEEALAALEPLAPSGTGARFLGLRLLAGEEDFARRAGAAEELLRAARVQREKLAVQGFDRQRLEDCVTAALFQKARALCAEAVQVRQGAGDRLDRLLDRLLCGPVTAWPVMLLMLLGIFYLSILGANAPSAWLAAGFGALEGRLEAWLSWLSAPPWLRSLLLEGVYRSLSWVVAVMLPPMAIFFPLFTFLEDAGVLPRVAFNLDRPFRRCGSCGKQALTMCMGFGCNAAGVTGCRIIASRRERMLAILTNAFVPCNGRFPILMTMIALFFSGAGRLGQAAALTGLILLSVLMSFAATALLGGTLYAGLPTADLLELPPYRMPQPGKLLLRSVLDRSLFVLGRAAAVAAPAGALLWGLARITLNGESLIALCAGALEPLGRFLGLDGAILLAFLLALPANETVLPILLMIYTAGSSMTELGALGEVKAILLSHGWTGCTALCAAVFTLFHWPCSTTLLTVKKETGGWGCAALSALLPTAFGLVLCMLIAGLWRLAA